MHDGELLEWLFTLTIIFNQHCWYAWSDRYVWTKSFNIIDTNGRYFYQISGNNLLEIKGQRHEIPEMKSSYAKTLYKWSSGSIWSEVSLFLIWGQGTFHIFTMFEHMVNHSISILLNSSATKLTLRILIHLVDFQMCFEMS